MTYIETTWTDRRATINSTFAKGGVSCSAASFVVLEGSILRLNICVSISGTSPSRRSLAGSIKKNEFKMRLYKKKWNFRT
ncbi:MAG: hypothetical protein EOP00_09710 [Pedobacter sp.]|nr:MAG: hypothetical protein EOP00_09710 [Pedobacter sp.]